MKVFAAACLAGVLCCGTPALADGAHGRDAAALVASLRAQWAARAAAGQTPAIVTEPSVVAGAILTPSIDVGVAPGVPAVQITVRAGTVGLNSLIATMTSPDGSRSVTSNFITPPAYPSEPPREVLKFTVASPFANSGFTLYTQPGTWTLSGLTLFTKDGEVVEYGPPQLSAVFPSTAVQVINNGMPDTTPPAAVNGTILTPTISLSDAAPTFAARLNVRDDVSGVASADVQIAGPPGSNFTFGAYVSVLYPVTNGRVVPALLLSSASPTGTYTITSVILCDVAGNCLYDTTPGAVAGVFGTATFQVVQ